MKVLREVEVVLDERARRHPRVQLCEEVGGKYCTRVLTGDDEVIFPPEGCDERAEAIDNLYLVGKIVHKATLTGLIGD